MGWYTKQCFVLQLLILINIVYMFKVNGLNEDNNDVYSLMKQLK